MVNQEIDISIIMPIYNAETYLEKTLYSIVRQTKKNIEVICVNDGSTDKSIEIVRKFAKTDSRFVVIDKENEGVSIARNRGLERAKGTYIMFLDADDWYDNETCERAYTLIEENHVDMAMFCMSMEYSDHSEYREIIPGELKKLDSNGCRTLYRQCLGLIGDECRRIQKLDYLSLVYLKIYKKSIIEENQIRFEDIRKIGSLEDGVFVMDYIRNISSAVYTPESLYHYNRCNSSSITTKHRGNLLKQWENLFDLLKERNKNYRGTEYSKALNNRMAYGLLTIGLNIVCGPEGIIKKYQSFKKLFELNSFYREFEWSEVIKMPKKFGIFFVLTKCNLKAIAFCFLYMMNYVRNKNKGLK